jgi:hypothetical protein
MCIIYPICLLQPVAMSQNKLVWKKGTQHTLLAVLIIGYLMILYEQQQLLALNDVRV